jgi:hypothetical protein
MTIFLNRRHGNLNFERERKERQARERERGREGERERGREGEIVKINKK